MDVSTAEGPGEESEDDGGKITLILQYSAMMYKHNIIIGQREKSLSLRM